jgi:NADH:ubiquinone reductase (H+-translocating)
VMWGFVHVLYLIGWGNRMGTLYTWMRGMVLSKNRGHRLITFAEGHDQALAHGGAAHRAVAPPRTAAGEMNRAARFRVAGGATGTEA